MATTRKQIAFDLDTNALKMYYPAYSWNNAYEVIKSIWLEMDLYGSRGLYMFHRKP